MKNIKFIYFLLFLFSIAFSSCNKDLDEPTSESTNHLRLYYSHNDDEKLIKPEDIIDLTWLDTIRVRIKSEDPFKITQLLLNCPESVYRTNEGNYQYTLSAPQSGLFEIDVCAVLREEDGSADSGVYETIDNSFFLHVPTIDYSLQRYAPTEYVIDVEDSALKAKIQSDLKLDSLSNFNTINLSCNSPSGGAYQSHIDNSSNVITGEFTSTDVSNLTDATFIYNGFKYPFSFSVSDLFSNGDAYCVLKQNLTEMYQQKYDSPDIKEVSISFKVFRHRLN
ncbi:MAG: hypothetical protein ACK5MI_09645 [Mangrovibacterium sp.]